MFAPDQLGSAPLTEDDGPFAAAAIIYAVDGRSDVSASADAGVLSTTVSIRYIQINIHCRLAALRYRLRGTFNGRRHDGAEGVLRILR